jgi:hypothetical protein
MLESHMPVSRKHVNFSVISMTTDDNPAGQRHQKRATSDLYTSAQNSRQVDWLWYLVHGLLINSLSNEQLFSIELVEAVIMCDKMERTKQSRSCAHA